ncbi:MAG: amino acid ABC transporter permease [Spirochaetaceae bacterium]
MAGASAESPRAEKFHIFSTARRGRIIAMDITIGIILLAAAAYFFYRVETELSYTWNWGVIPRYLVRIGPEGVPVPNSLLIGFFYTLKLAVWSSLFAAILGTLMGVLRAGKGLFGNLVGGTYVSIVRNLPPLVLIFIVYYFVSDQVSTVLGIDEMVAGAAPGTKRVLTSLFTEPSRFSAFLAAVLTLGLYEGAYVTEIVRSGIHSIPKGQWEASYTLGLSPYRKYRHVILPQAWRKTLPPLAGQFISTIKDSAIVSVISVQELTFQGLELMAATHLTFEIWITITLMYFVLTFSCSSAIRRLEVRLQRRYGD